MIDLNVDEIIELCEYEIDREMITGLEREPRAVHYNPVGAMLEMAKKLKKAEKDAARYRWLRDNCTTQQADAIGPTFVMTIRRKDNLFNVGLSIDEAMQCSK